MTAAIAYKEPLTVDPVLWEAFAADREVAPWGRSPRLQRRVRPGDRCNGPCGRPMRPSSAPKTDYPDTTKHGRGGVCATCINYPEGAGKAVRIRGPRVQLGDLCRGWCGLPMRPAGRPAAALPGSVVHKGKQMCATCYQRHLREAS